MTGDEAFARRVMTDYRTAGLNAVDLALCEYAEKLTRTPHQCSRTDVQALRDVGLSDAAILEAAHVVGHFAYANRLADGLGVEPEPEMGTWSDGVWER